MINVKGLDGPVYMLDSAAWADVMSEFKKKLEQVTPAILAAASGLSQYTQVLQKAGKSMGKSSMLEEWATLQGKTPWPK